MFTRILLVLTVSAISKNAFKWRRDHRFPYYRGRLPERPRDLTVHEDPDCARTALHASGIVHVVNSDLITVIHEAS